MEHFINAGQFEKLKEFANQLRKHYYGHVYLFGSSLERNDFTDVDIAVVISNEYFEMRYGNVKDFVGESWGKGAQTITRIWEQDCEKKWAMGCKYTGLNLDFRVLPNNIFNFKKPYIQLDID